MAKLETKKLSVWYGPKQALKDISLSIPANSITTLIGPSGCGKTSLLRVFNRMSDLNPECRIEGDALLDGASICANGADPMRVRRRVGMIFPRPNPFPLSIFDNVAYGPRIHALCSGSELTARVEASLQEIGLWEAVRERIHHPAQELSPEQQQRLCMARLLAIGSDVLLLDEPCIELDWVGTARMEELLRALKSKYTILMATHNVQQAGRISDWTAYLTGGELVEYGETQTLFTQARKPETENYISGRFH